MFERFTDRARRVVVLAQEEARMLNHSYIGTEHLLLGLLAEADGIGARALAELGLTLEAARRIVEERIGRGAHAPIGHIPFTPRSKKVLEFALRESRKLGHTYIGTEHLLLGMATEGEGVGAAVLQTDGRTLAEVRQTVFLLIQNAGAAHEATPSPTTNVEHMSELITTFLEGFVARLDRIEQRLDDIDRKLAGGAEGRTGT